MAAFDPVEWATIGGTWVLVVGTLSFAYWQLRQNQRLHSASTLLDLREQYFGGRMKRARKEFSSWLLHRPGADDKENWEVPIFFEQLGFLTHTRVLDKRMVWNAFGTWVTGYYYLLTHPDNKIEAWRQEDSDPLIFREFEWLATELLAMESRLLRVHGGSHYGEADARYTMEIESNIRLDNPADA